MAMQAVSGLHDRCVDVIKIIITYIGYTLLEVERF